MRRSRITAALLASAAIAFTVSRCDRRTPGGDTAPKAAETLDAGVVRRDVRFPCADSTCAAWLYLPPAQTKPPVVVMAHGFAGTRDVALGRFAESFARAGIAALVFDYRHFGGSGGEPRQIVDPWRQLDDGRAAIAFARTLPEVDGGRVALWGSSMGAGHALIIASEDGELRAVVAQAPLIDTGVEGDATSYGALWAARLLFTGWADFAASAWGAAPLAIPAIDRGGGFGMIVDDEAYAAFERLVPPGSTYRNGVAARSVFLFDDYNPAAHAGSIRTPVLLIASRRDRFAPFSAVQALAEHSPNVSVVTFDGDHFDVYSPPAADVAADAATKFLAQHLGAQR